MNQIEASILITNYIEHLNVAIMEIRENLSNLPHYEEENFEVLEPINRVIRIMTFDAGKLTHSRDYSSEK